MVVQVHREQPAPNGIRVKRQPCWSIRDCLVMWDHLHVYVYVNISLFNKGRSSSRNFAQDKKKNSHAFAHRHSCCFFPSGSSVLECCFCFLRSDDIDTDSDENTTRRKTYRIFIHSDRFHFYNISSNF